MHSRGRTDCVGREITADISTRIFPHTRRKPSTQIRRSPQLPIMLPLIAVKIHILPHPPPHPLSPQISPCQRQHFPLHSTTLTLISVAVPELSTPFTYETFLLPPPSNGGCAEPPHTTTCSLDLRAADVRSSTPFRFLFEGSSTPIIACSHTPPYPSPLTLLPGESPAVIMELFSTDEFSQNTF